MKRAFDRSVSRPVGCTDIAHDWSSAQFCEHYHRERNHQGLDNEIIEPDFGSDGAGEVRCRERLGGSRRYCYRDAAWKPTVRVFGHYGEVRCRERLGGLLRYYLPGRRMEPAVRVFGHYGGKHRPTGALGTVELKDVPGQ